MHNKIYIHDCKWDGARTVIIVSFGFYFWNILFVAFRFRIVTPDTQNSQLRGFCSSDKKKRSKKISIVNKWIGQQINTKPVSIQFFIPFVFDRCKIWVEKTRRFDLLNKTNVHDERICQQHFEANMFLNGAKNRLQPYAVPTLLLSAQRSTKSSSSMDDLRINRFSNGSPFNVC